MTQSFRWINMVLESLIECYTRLEEENPDQHGSISKEDSPAEKVRAELYEWRRTSVKRIDLMNLMHQELAQSLHQFLHDATKFHGATDRVHALMRSQQNAKNRLHMPTTVNTHQQS